MPVAINFSTHVTLIPLAEHRLEIFSESFNEEIAIDLNKPPTKANDHWSDYPVGVAVMLLRAGYAISGARLSIQSDVPIGSGLSSSAAIEVATAFALTRSSGEDVERAELARLCRKAENEFVGARVGIMDQFISLFGERDKALQLDCRSLEYKLLPLSTEAQLVICNTMVKHALASGAYNERRAQCEAGVLQLSSELPGIKALRDVSPGQLEEHKNLLSEVVYRRCRHIVTENDRVLAAGEALEHNDLNRFGSLMNASHESLRDDYEVSCKELDLMVGFAREVEGVFGARMTGGGFGGCTVNLVTREHLETFRTVVATRYEEATGLKPEIYVCTAENGAEELKSPRDNS